MTTSQYSQVLELVEQLSLEDQQQLLVEVATWVQQHSKPMHSVLEFEGVGEANPIGIDAQEFVNQERDSWDG
ncbi:MAG: hypothetical protein H0X37_18535 [Herpetosiphonaceae bacterium]|nr:hypothetical protein [Herpetosiphonaceae bacterium]